MSLDQYSTTPSNNDLTNYFKTGMRPSTVKAAGWDMMADLAQLLNYLPTSAGTANAQTLANPRPFSSLTNGLVVFFKPLAANTGDWTFAPDGLGAKHVYSCGALCSGGEASPNFPLWLRYDTSLGSGAGGWHIQNPVLGPLGLLSGALEATVFTANGNFTPKATANYLVMGIGGGGGGGGGSGGVTGNGGAGGGGGGGGAIGFSVVALVAGTAYAVVLGSGGSGGSNGTAGNPGSSGNSGTSTTFNGVTIGSGGNGGVGTPATSSFNARGFGGGAGCGYGGGLGGISVAGIGPAGGTGSPNTGGGGGGGGGGANANAGGPGGTGGSGILVVVRA